MFTAGMSTDIDWTNWDITTKSSPLNPFRPGETLACTSGSSYGSLHADAAQQAAASSAILMIMVLVFSLVARYLSYRIDKKMGGNN